MVDINIHNIIKVEIDKYDLDGGTWVCKIDINSENPLTKNKRLDTITLFSESLQTYRNLKN